HVSHLLGSVQISILDRNTAKTPYCQNNTPVSFLECHIRRLLSHLMVIPCDPPIYCNKQHALQYNWSECPSLYLVICPAWYDTTLQGSILFQEPSNNK